MPSFAGQPRPRADASICERSLSRSPEEITRILRESIQAGRVGGPWEGDFPRYVWGGIEEMLFEYLSEAGLTAAIPNHIPSGPLTEEGVQDLAEAFGTSSFIIRHQIENHGIARIRSEL